MSIIKETTPNPNALKFVADHHLFSGEKSYPLYPGETSEYPILNDLLALEGVIHVFGFQDFVTVNKDESLSWESLLPQVEAILKAYDF